MLEIIKKILAIWKHELLLNMGSLNLSRTELAAVTIADEEKPARRREKTRCRNTASNNHGEVV